MEVGKSHSKNPLLEINLGHILVSKEVIDKVRENQEFAIYVKKCLEKYKHGEWGDISDYTGQINDRGLKMGRRLFSSYESNEYPEIWITTEPDRSYSTIMCPDEQASLDPLDDYSVLFGQEFIKSN